MTTHLDRVGAFLREKTPRRFVAVAAFLTLLWLFRHLALLLVFFVTFERALGAASRFVGARAKLPPKRALLVVLAGVLVLLVAVGWLGVGKSIKAYTAMHSRLPERIAELRENPLVVRLQEQVGGTERIVERAREYAGDALGAASAVGHFFIDVLIGFILAIVFRLEEDELHAFGQRIEPRSLFGTLGRWMRHLADATIVTVQLQLVVAACNTMMTLPVLLLIGVPHVGGLMLLIFVSALVPVIGNIVSGAVLSLMAYQAKGWLGVGVFVALTFVLHKIESYYLSPRLTARHVHIPGFFLIVSLLAFEHLFGFKGLFLSFPFLFVAGRIRREMAEEDGREAAA